MWYQLLQPALASALIFNREQTATDILQGSSLEYLPRCQTHSTREFIFGPLTWKKWPFWRQTEHVWYLLRSLQQPKNRVVKVTQRFPSRVLKQYTLFCLSFLKSLCLISDLVLGGFCVLVEAGPPHSATRRFESGETETLWSLISVSWFCLSFVCIWLITCQQNYTDPYEPCKYLILSYI